MTQLNRVGNLLHRSWWIVLLESSAFGLAVIGPWLWIQFRTQPTANQFFFTARREIPKYGFINVTLGSQVEESLGASELFNGHFINVRSQRVSVFAANWKPGQGDLGSVGHTPEKCWVGTGFKIVPYGGPSQMFISIAGIQIPFQCRVFKHSDLAVPEITLWAACIDGQWDEIPYEPPLEPVEHDGSALNRFQEIKASYRNRWAFFRERLLFRSNLAARKQVVRFSTPLTTDWQPALVELSAFAKLWLEPN